MTKVALITDAPLCLDPRALRMYRVLSEAGYQVGVFDQGEQIARTCELVNADQHYPSMIPSAGIERAWWHFMNRATPLSAYRKRIQARIDDLTSFYPDIIWCANVFDLEAATTVSNNLAVPLVYEAYEYWPEHLVSEEYSLPTPLSRYLQELERSSASHVDHFVTVSPTFAQWYHDELDFPRAHLIANAHIPDDKMVGADGERDDHETEASTTLRIIHSGQVTKNRNVNAAIDAMELTSNAQLTIMGSGPGFDELVGTDSEAIIIKPAVAHEDLIDTLRHYDVGLLLYDVTAKQTDGTLPNKLYDYLGAGLAMIAVSTTALKAFDGITLFARLIAGATPELIAEAIQELVDDRVRLSEMKRSSARIGMNYRASMVAQSILDLIEKVGTDATGPAESEPAALDDAPGPFLSFLIPAYNAQETIEQTVSSVLEQKGCDFEVIIVDDGSTDETATLIESLYGSDQRVKLIQQENQGTGGALRTAAAHAQGEWLLMLGADDYFPADALEKRQAFMQRHPGFDIYSSDYFYIFDDGHLEQAPNWGKIRSITLDEQLTFPFIAGNALFKRSVLDSVGGFRPQFFNEDYDLWLRMLAHGATHIHQPEPLEYYRIHEGQKTDDAIRMRSDDSAILADLIDSGLLSPDQERIALEMIERYRRRTRIRKRLYSLIGKKPTEALIKAVRR